MKAWHILLPLLGMASMAVVFEKREHDAAVAELQTARALSEARGPLLQRGPSSIVEAQPPHATTATAMQDRYQRAFDSESRNAPWADAAEPLARQRLSALVPAGGAVRTVECRSSMCRFETSHADRSSYERFVRTSFMGPSPGVWNAPEFSGLVEPRAEGVNNGPVLAVSYLAREGQSLPALD